MTTSTEVSEPERGSAHLTNFVLVWGSVQRDTRTHPKCNYLEKPDPEVVPALRPLLQPDPK